MKKYFNVFFEFDHTEFENIIETNIKSGVKGYVCVVDGNVLALANRDEAYKTIVNNSLVNACDGSSIALMINKIHKKKYQVYTGPEIFSYYIGKGYKQFFLGNTEDILNQLRSSFEKGSIDINSMRFATLPFLKVDEFDYTEIGKMINEFAPELIWVSLTPPKKEIFISKLLPHLRTGVMFAIGAAFNLYLGSGSFTRAPEWMRKMHLEWLFRVVKEPLRIGKRAWNYAIIIPGLIMEEKRRMRNIILN